MCNFVRGCYEEQFCEIILNLGQWFRCCLKDLSRALAALASCCSKFFEIWISGSRGNVV